MSSVEVSSRILGCGMYVPEKVLDNHYFASYLDTSDQWIRERTGIEQRRWVEPGTSASDISLSACREAIKNSKLEPADINGIVVATSSPDNTFPSTACFLQEKLGVASCFSFDISAACSGFIYALTVANSLLSSELASNILVVGADVFSNLVDKNDRTTCILFADGAGAVVLSRYHSAVSQDLNPPGILATKIYSDGKFAKILCCPMGSANPISEKTLQAKENFIKMQGREVFKLAVRSLVDVNKEVIKESGYKVSDIDYFISHQANSRILSKVAEELEIEPHKMLLNLDRYGNTSAASIPILLAEERNSGRIKSGDLVCFSAFGAGTTWGAMLVRF